MEDNTESHERPAAPVPRIVLPTGVKVTGWILLLAGAWNLFFGIVAGVSLLPEESGLALVVLPFFFRLIVPWAAVAFVGSIGLLLRKEWGRKATIFAVYYFMASMVAWAVFCNVLLLRRHETSAELVFMIFGIVISSAVMLAAIFGLYMLARYLGKPKVRAAFRH